MSDMQIVLVDLSSISFPIWMMAQNDPDPNATCTKTIERVRALTSGHLHSAICCDSGRSFRHDVSTDYKANREKQAAPYFHQVSLIQDALRGDGYPVWSVANFEADDLIASATVRALDSPDLTVLIISADKDLLQLVSQRVTAFSPATATTYDVAAVQAKFGVSPSAMNDYLCLVGDSSDNVRGAKGVGPKTAAKLLTEFGSLEALYAQMTHGATPSITPAVRTSLRDFESVLLTTRELITLRTDVEIPFDQLAAERQAVETAAFLEETPMMSDLLDAQDAAEEMHTNGAGEMQSSRPDTTSGRTDQAQALSPAAPVSTGNGHALVVKDADVPAPAPAEWERHLEPRSMREAITLANHMYSARLFSAYGTPQAVLSTILAGREFNMPAMASLRAFHIVEGKPTLAADAIRAFVLRSGKATYFRCTERTSESATFETQRGDDPPIALSYTMEEARASGRVKEKSGYAKDPADMLVARAGSKLARLVYPDVIHGLYSPEEFD